MMKASIYIVVVGAFFTCSCRGPAANPRWSDPPRLSTEKLDTVKRARYPVGAAPYIFETAFFSGTKDKLYGKTVEFFAVNIGKIKIESGKIIACDPIDPRDAPAFAATFPVGLFPVQLSIAKIELDERVAFSRILFSDSAVQRWELAVHPGQKLLSIYDSTFYGYGVDGGIGLFVDSVANAVFVASLNADQKVWDEVFIKEMGRHERLTWDYTLHSFGGHNLACFSTGWGDGTYGLYIGYDRDGGICQLLTDFDLVDWNK
jgi:hypothetical protein